MHPSIEAEVDAQLLFTLLGVRKGREMKGVPVGR